jgi:hypothetical protein
VPGAGGLAGDQGMTSEGDGQVVRGDAAAGEDEEEEVPQMNVVMTIVSSR